MDASVPPRPPRSAPARSTVAPGWREAPAPDLRFPYMVWAHTHAARTRLPLSGSGLAPADPGFLTALGHQDDLQHAGSSALPALEEALARRYGVPRERVVVTLGASGGMYACAARWFAPGDRVAADLPSYEPFRALPARFGAECVALERRPEERYALDPDRVAAALGARAGGRGHVFVSNPHNPTGASADRGTLAACARAAERAGGVLISCDIYMEYVPAERAVWAFEAAPNAVTIGSLTKAYGLGPLRVGWIVLGEGLVAEGARIVDEAYLAWVDPPTYSLRAGAAALARLADLRQPLARIERESRPIWARWLATTPGIDAFVPPHGIIAFPRVEGVADTHALCEFLVRDHGVDVVPGEFFGAPGHVRVGCGLPPALLEEALARLANGIRSFRSERASSGARADLP